MVVSTLDGMPDSTIITNPNDGELVALSGNTANSQLNFNDVRVKGQLFDGQALFPKALRDHITTE